MSPTLPLLEFAIIDILEELVMTLGNNQHSLVVSERFTKLVWIVSIRAATAECAAKAFETYWDMTYGPPRILLSEYGRKLSSQDFYTRVRS